MANSSPHASTTSAPDAAADHVVLVVPSASTPGSYVVCSLVENTTTALARRSPTNRDDESTSAPPLFQLKTHTATATATADAVPPGLLGRLLVKATPSHLHGTVDVVISTGSGAGHALPFWTNVLEPLLTLVEANTSSGAKCHRRIVVTQDAHTVRFFSHAKWRSSRTSTSPQTIIVLSGDGGIVDLLNGTDGCPPACAVPPTLAVLPLGTANALFHSLHKPLYRNSEASALVLALRTLFTGKEATLPVFRTSFSKGARLVHGDALGLHVAGLTGAIVASYGLHASIVWESDTPEYRQFGPRRFGMVAAELLRQSHAYRARVDITATTPSGVATATAQSDSHDHGYVLATLVSNLERTFTISPASEPLDGRLRLVRFGAVGGEKAREIMMAAYKEGAHVGMRWSRKAVRPQDGAQQEGGRDEEDVEDGVAYDEVDEITVTILEKDARWRKVCVDGTVVEIPTGGTMTVRPGETSPFKVLVDESVLPAGI